uniref:Uncharacterized protein n=1 Tax=Anguilla anguilla TaxID=7936 RepID=A0A0E9PAF0_ANGAN
MANKYELVPLNNNVNQRINYNPTEYMQIIHVLQTLVSPIT